MVVEIPECPVLDKVIEIGYATEGVKAFRWPTMTSTVRQLCEFLSDHKEGKKDGLSILQGTVIKSSNPKSGDRKATAVDKLCLLILDIDSGESMDALEKKIRDLGLFSILHTTFSHNATETKIKKDALLKWIGDDEKEPTLEQAIAYLKQAKRINPYVLTNATLKGTVQENEGIMLVVAHKPLPRTRVLFVLKEPFVIAERGGSQKKAIEEWKERYVGMARKLNAVYDRACVDPSRLMYTPRHPKGRTDFEVRIIPGEALDIESIDRVSLKGEERDNIWIQEGEEDKRQYQTRAILPFVAKYASVFDAVEFVRDHREIRRDDGTKVTCECPNDDAHSDAGNPDDMGFFVGANDDGAFVMKCMHDSCSELDRVDFLDMICVETGMTVDDLKEYVSELEEDDKPQPEKEDTGPTATFENLDEILEFLRDDQSSITESRIEEFLELAGKFKPTKVQIDLIADLVFKKTKVTRATCKGVIDKAIAKEKQKQLDGSEALYNIPKDVVTKLEEETKIYSVCLMKGDVRVLRKNRDYRDEPYEILTLESYRALRANDNVVCSWNGETRTFNVGKEFITWAGRPTYDDGLVFEPNGGQGKIFNHWNGFKIAPQKGKWSAVKNHLYYAICQENEEYFDWLLTWLAHIFQHPGKKVGTAIVLKGKKGAGKSIVFEQFLSRIMTPYFLKVSNSKHVTSQFNGHLFGKLVLLLEEAVWAGDTQAEGVLKDLITSERIPYEFKGQTIFDGSNYTRLIFLSNEDWVVPATHDERRYFVLQVSDEYLGDNAYFDELVEEIENPDAQAAFVDEMLNMKVPDWNILRQPPKTSWLSEQVTQAMKPEDRFFVEMVANYGLDADTFGRDLSDIQLNSDDITEVQITDIFDHYVSEINRYGTGTLRRAKPKKVFESKLEKLCLATIDYRNDGVGGKRIGYVTFPPVKRMKEHLNREGYGPI